MGLTIRLLAGHVWRISNHNAISARFRSVSGGDAVHKPDALRKAK